MRAHEEENHHIVYSRDFYTWEPVGVQASAFNFLASGTYKIEISFFNNLNRVMLIQTLNLTPGTPDFEFLRKTITVPANYTKIVFRFDPQKGTGVEWFDDTFPFQLP